MFARNLKYSNLILWIVIFSTLNLQAQRHHPVTAEKGMVVCAEPLAAKIGLQVLKKGGNAIDAAVAVGFALAVTYPTAGNLGGGGYMVIHLKDGRDIAIDYREIGPASATKNMYLNKEGKVETEKIQLGETAAAVPGSVAGMLYALDKYGTLKRKDIVQPALNAAISGFQVSTSFASSLARNSKELSRFPSTKKIFFKNDSLYREGEILKQPDLAKTLQRIIDFGSDGFYKGETADLLCKQIIKGNGYISLSDLAGYAPVERDVVRGTYHGYDIVSMPPSSSGGVILIEILNILEQFQFTQDEYGSAKYYHILTEAMKHAYADRAVHLGDPAFWKVPVTMLLSKNYASDIARQINGKARPSGKILAGSPEKYESPQTTHYSVTDKEGNAVSVTTTINSEYGAKVVVEGAGFFLNNEMDDFAAKPGVPNQFGLVGGDANSIAPRKRMLSSMTPTIVLKNGKPVLILGSPGGSTIITATLQVLLNVIDFKMNVADAVAAPRIHHQWLPDRIDYELNGLALDVRTALKNKGQIIGEKRVLGLVEAIYIDPLTGQISGCSDPRGSGAAEGY
ncbi:MAG: gamma-glutamyltransferase [Ignavibacteria bacterium]|nr:gamma-glutamyltransferase [Ignavibacteria bacterium]